MAASRRDPPPAASPRPKLEGSCLGLQTWFDFQKKPSEVLVRSLLYVRGRLAPSGVSGRTLAAKGEEAGAAVTARPGPGRQEPRCGVRRSGSLAGSFRGPFLRCRAVLSCSGGRSTRRPAPTSFALQRERRLPRERAAAAPSSNKRLKGRSFPCPCGCFVLTSISLIINVKCSLFTSPQFLFGTWESALLPLKEKGVIHTESDSVFQLLTRGLCT